MEAVHLVSCGLVAKTVHVKGADSGSSFTRRLTAPSPMLWMRRPTAAVRRDALRSRVARETRRPQRSSTTNCRFAKGFTAVG